MSYLLDSDIVIDVLNGFDSAIRQVNLLLPSGVSISIITYIEVYQGVLEEESPQSEIDRFTEFIAAVRVLPLSEEVARRCAVIRIDLKRRGRRFRSRQYDLIIAATALEQS